ncbi:cyclase family protein [Conexibacter woesei]|uniref:cyclase family protein n=1 Tax=Conexibacter woesei TaxID=191495 RepID=UPI0004176854|nr:cyclase family protein [Conexibacter woesei]
MSLRFVDLNVPIQEPLPGELNGGMGAILAASIEYQSHEETRPEFGMMFGGATEKDMPGGFAIGAEKLQLTAHAGTHVDAPWHYYPTSEGKPARTIDQLELEHFFAPGVVVDLRGHAPGDRIEVDELAAAVQRTGAPLAPGDIVCLWFGHDERFGTRDYWDDYPGLGAEATRWLIGQGIKVIGTDAPGLDRGNPYMARDFQETGDASLLWEAHRVGIDHEYFQIEKLANLGELPARGFYVACFPVKIKGASAGWCRAVAIFGLEVAA